MVDQRRQEAKERKWKPCGFSNWGFAFESKTLFQRVDVVGYAQVYGGSSGSEPLVSEAPIRVLIPRDSDEKLKGQIVYTGPLMTPVSPGQEVAHLRVFRGPDEILEVPLRTLTHIGPGTLPRRAMDASLELRKRCSANMC